MYIYIPTITKEFTYPAFFFFLQDLASRSVSVADLLHFWEKIPELMPHFDERATTHDVVRQVVIPMSKLGVYDQQRSSVTQKKTTIFHQRW